MKVIWVKEKTPRSSSEKPMGRQRINPKSDWVALDTYLREVAGIGKYQMWFRAVSSLPMDLTTSGKTPATRNSVMKPIKKQCSLIHA